MPDTVKGDILIASIRKLLPPDKQCYLLAQGNDYAVIVVKLAAGTIEAFYFGDQANCLLAAQIEKATGEYPWLSECELGTIEWFCVCLQ